MRTKWDIGQEVADALGDYVDDYDVDEIIDEMEERGLIEWDEVDGPIYTESYDADDFWDIVQKHDRTHDADEA